MKLHISGFTWLIWGIAWLNGSWKPMLFLFLLMSMHELCHCLMALFLRLPVEGVAIYPFGLCATMETLRWHPPLVQLSVLAAGPAVHLVVPLFLRLLLLQDGISLAFYDWCLSMNQQLLLFNCLPIYPLDGAGLLLVIFFGFFPVKKALFLLHVVSLGMILWAFSSWIRWTPAAFLIAFLLGILNLCGLTKREKSWHDACLYRISTIPVYPQWLHCHDDFYLYRHNYFFTGSTILEEKEWLWQILGKKKRHDDHFMV